MEDFLKVAKGLKKNIEKLQLMNNDLLKSIQSENPDVVDALMKDNKELMKALKTKDVDSIVNIHKKYADKSNK
tara:strand:- start:9989 stop:10207 length:219 start_codon:yes stop_codon:yes gene_type:complete